MRVTTIAAPLSNAAPDAITFGQAGASGVSTEGARIDHAHQMVVAPRRSQFIAPHRALGTSTLGSGSGNYVGASLGNTTANGSAGMSGRMASDMTTLRKAVAVGIPDTTGTLHYQVVCNMAAAGEAKTTHASAPGDTGVATVADAILEIDISAALAALAAGDAWTVDFTRLGTIAGDDNNVFILLGIYLEWD